VWPWLQGKDDKGQKKARKEKAFSFHVLSGHEVGHLANSCPNKEKLKK